MEEELSTLAATLGRVQLEKNQIEKDNANIRNQLEKIQNNLKTLQVTPSNMLPHLDMIK